ncbi:MAG TPA: TetR/AcrR family transcriptional regulator C-terminal domain-containing protein [Amycolatopsis sp.]|nr:TetR/AcrR family transcriptional regulator C-terminal domain-containing protein [Amycolatopsis sp.]
MTERRPWGSLERPQIIDAALRIARAEGIEALTIRRLATEVGASRMALYRHVPDKNALLDLLADEIAAHHVIPGEALDGPWPDRLRHLAHGMRRELRAYPGFAERLVTHGNATPGGLRIAETIADILAAAGLDSATAARFYLITIDVVIGRAHREVRGDPTTQDRNATLFAAAEASRDAARFTALLPSLRTVTSDEIFAAELDMLIEAIRATAR